MSALSKKRYAVDEYFELERTHVERYEYFRGEVFAMAGASKPHNIITTNLTGLLHPQLRQRSCLMFASDMRVRISPQYYTYPDVVIVYGHDEIDPEPLDTLLNPTVIIEVLSPSTEDYDKEGKGTAFRGIASLQEYILIAQAEIQVQHYIKQAEGFWHLIETTDPLQQLSLRSIDCVLQIGELYEKVVFKRSKE